MGRKLVVRMSTPLFESVYRAYFGRVYQYLLSLCRDPHLAEDLTAETFLKAMKGLDGFRGDSDLHTWLCAIGKNQYLSHLRRHPEAVPLEEAVRLPGSEAADPARKAEQNEEVMELYSKLHKLPEPYKEVFLLRTLGTLSFRQIGELFGKTENWACVTYHRARKKLLEERWD